MGSDGKRRTKDQVRIDKPLNNLVNSSTGAEGGGASEQTPPDINNICPPAFRVKLAVQNLAANTSLTLEDKIIRLKLPPQLEVGRLTATQIKMIQTCSSMGISYDAIRVILDKEGNRYAEITQQ